MACTSCGRYRHKGPDICDSCKAIQEYNKPAQTSQGSSSGMFKPQWEIEQIQRQEAQRRVAEQERRQMDEMQRIVGSAGLDLDRMYQQIQGRRRSGPQTRDYSGKPKKVMILKIV